MVATRMPNFRRRRLAVETAIRLRNIGIMECDIPDYDRSRPPRREIETSLRRLAQFRIVRGPR